MSAPASTVEDLTDGVAMAQALHLMYVSLTSNSVSFYNILSRAREAGPPLKATAKYGQDHPCPLARFKGGL